MLIPPLLDLFTRIGRHGMLYLAASASVGLAGVVQVAILTRLLSTSEFGQLAVLTVFSASLTVFVNLGSLQGAFRSVFGTTGDDEIGDEGSNRGSQADDPAKALGNALALTAALGIVAALLTALAARPLADLLAGDADMATAVALAGLSGGIGAVWRLAANVSRLERRPRTYAAVSAGRALLVLSGMTLGVALGGGLEGAVAGMAAGTGLGLAGSLVAIRSSVEPTFDPRDWPRIFALGAGLVPVVLSFWAIQNGDVLILAAYAPESEVGVYRAGSRIAAVVAYAMSAVLMAWGPLTREPLQAAVDAQHGREHAGARLASAFAIGGLTLLLAVTLFANDLARVAGSSFEAAATIIPLVAAGLLAHGMFVVVYRVAQAPRKRRAFVQLSGLAAGVFLAAALVLVPPFGGAGAAISVIVGYGIALAAMLVVSQRGSRPLPLDARRIGAVVALFTIAVVVGRLTHRLPAPVGSIGALVVLFTYVAALVATDVIPRTALVRLLLTLRTPDRRPDDLTRLAALDEDERTLLRRAAGPGRRPNLLTRFDEADDGDVPRRLVAALRVVAGVGPPHPADIDVARYLLASGATAERDLLARRLWTSDGIDPAELEAIRTCLARLRSLRPEDWRAASGRPPY
jgi:O-antigen/teichoic acid export membrane protein